MSKNKVLILTITIILSISIIHIKSDDEIMQRPQKVDASKSGVITLTSENLDFEISKYEYGFVLFTSDDCQQSQAVEPMYHETCNKFNLVLNENEEEELKKGDARINEESDSEKKKRLKDNIERVSKYKKKLKKNLNNMGFYIINGKKSPELMEKYNINRTPHIIWFNRVMDHYRIYSGDTELPKYFFEFALKQAEYKIEEITLKDLLKFPEEKELEGQNLILFVGNEKGKNNFYYSHLMQVAFNNDIVNLYKSNDEEIKKYFKIIFKNDINNFDAIIFKIRNKKIDLNQFERLNLSSFDFMQLNHMTNNSNALSGAYSKSFDLNKATNLKKIRNLIKIFSHHPVSEFHREKEELIQMGIPTITFVHDYDFESKEYADVLKYLTEISMKYRRDLLFMISSKYSKITQLFAEVFSLDKKYFPAVCLTSILKTSVGDQKIDKYRLVSNLDPYSNLKSKRELEYQRELEAKSKKSKSYSDDNKSDVITKEKIIEFIEDWKNMNLPVFHPSEETPKEPKDEYNIYKFVANNFKRNLKNNENKFILLTICSNRLEICEKFRERLIRISHKLKKTDKIIVGEFNPYLNEIDGEFEAKNIPSVFLLPDRGERIKDAKRYEGRLNTRDIVNWAIEQCDLKNYEENKLPLQETLFLEEDLNDLKALDMENKSISRMVYTKIMDPVQKELWEFPEKEEIKLESDFYEDFYMRFFNPELPKEKRLENKEFSSDTNSDSKSDL